MRTVLVTLAHVCSALVISAPALGEPRCSAGPTGPDQARYLTRCRPAPVTPAARHLAVASLPPSGHLTAFTPAQQIKIGSLARVLRLHEREAVYTLRVIDVPEAWAGLHERAVLLVSAPAVDLLHAEELQALVAHEVGHEFLATEYDEARAARDARRLRRVELACDAIAALTLESLGVSPEHLASALDKIYWFNRMRYGVADESGYPSPEERRHALSRLRVARR
jgi:hypothetical protein